MAGSENQKFKLLYLYRILMEETDEEHVLTTPQLIEKLAAKGIKAERKSIYADLAALRDEFGVDIIDVGRGGHYVGSRTFEFPEVRLLADSVLSSRFITERKTVELVEKLKTLASEHQAKQLTGRMFVADRVKSMNSSVYYSVDTIASAIDAGCKVSFKYYGYDAKKEKQYHHGGNAIEVSPYDLVWDNEYYYLVAYDGADQKIKHYRIDRLERIRVLDKEKREGADAYKKANVRSYSKRMFSMFSGEEQAVTLRFADHLANVIIDRFGKDVILAPDGEGHSRVSVTVFISPQFYGWLFGLGPDIEVLAPKAVRDAYAQKLSEVLGAYGTQGEPL